MNSQIASLTREKVLATIERMDKRSYQNLLQAFGIVPNAANYAKLHAKLVELKINL